MNAYQIAKQNSFSFIVREARNYPASVKLIPKFSKAIDRLEKIVSEIDALRIQQEKDLKGITLDKNYTLDDLADFTLEFAGAVFSYAQDKRDNSTMEKVNYKPGMMTKMSQDDIINAAGIVLEMALKVPAASLVEEGISAQELKTFEALVTSFKKIKLTPGEAKIDRSVYTEKLRELFKEASTLKKNVLDRLAPQFRRKDPDFYLRYRKSCNVEYSRKSKEKDENGTEKK